MNYTDLTALLDKLQAKLDDGTPGPWDAIREEQTTGDSTLIFATLRISGENIARSAFQNIRNYELAAAAMNFTAALIPSLRTMAEVSQRTLDKYPVRYPVGPPRPVSETESIWSAHSRIDTIEHIALLMADAWGVE